MQGMAPPPHMTPEFEAQMRNHVQGGGALPAGAPRLAAGGSGGSL